MNPEARHTSKWAGAVLVAGVGLTLLVAGLTYRAEERERRMEFQERAQTRMTIASSVWPELIMPLRSVQSFFMASTQVSREEFSIFTQAYLDQKIGVGYFGWTPLVFDMVVPFHESHGRTEGLESYELKALPRDVKEPPWQPPAISFPVYYVNPLARHEGMLGVDLASDATNREVLQEACDENRLTARIDPDRLPSGTCSNSLCIVAPVYAQGGGAPRPSSGGTACWDTYWRRTTCPS